MILANIHISPLFSFVQQSSDQSSTLFWIILAVILIAVIVVILLAIFDDEDDAKEDDTHDGHHHKVEKVEETEETTIQDEQPLETAVDAEDEPVTAGIVAEEPAEVEKIAIPVVEEAIVTPVEVEEEIVAEEVVAEVIEEEVEAAVVPEPEEPEPIVPDNLRKIEGIGPKISSILNEAGIFTFAQLAAATVPHLEKVVRVDAGIRLAHPDTWPEQAQLAAGGQWDALQTLQDSLKGGRYV